jgi:hypothetical protein
MLINDFLFYSYASQVLFMTLGGVIKYRKVANFIEIGKYGLKFNINISCVCDKIKWLVRIEAINPLVVKIKKGTK